MLCLILNAHSVLIQKPGFLFSNNAFVMGSSSKQGKEMLGPGSRLHKGTQRVPFWIALKCERKHAIAGEMDSFVLSEGKNKKKKKKKEKAFQKEICDWSSPELFNLLGIFSRWILTHVLHFAIPCNRAMQHLPLVFLSRHAHNAGGNGGENYANCSEQITLTSCSSSSSIKGLPGKANLDYICQSHTLRLSHCRLVSFSPNRDVSYSEVKCEVLGIWIAQKRARGDGNSFCFLCGSTLPGPLLFFQGYSQRKRFISMLAIIEFYY